MPKKEEWCIEEFLGDPPRWKPRRVIPELEDSDILTFEDRLNAEWTITRINKAQGVNHCQRRATRIDLLI